MTAGDIVARWGRQGPLTDPREQAALLDDLPADLPSLCRAISGLLIHSDWLPEYGVAAADFASVSRETLPVAARLRQIHRADGRPLGVARTPHRRSVATCRDYAVMLCAILRHRGTAARVRCGFASYLEPGRWEDHWVCERWLPEEGRWAIADAQLDEVMCGRLGIAFDRADLPPEAFVAAGDAWLDCRRGDGDPDCFGHGDARGWWFLRVNVVRDHLALQHRERSDWDSWRQAGGEHQRVAAEALEGIDALAAHPDRTPARMPLPPWM